MLFQEMEYRLIQVRQMLCANGQSLELFEKYVDSWVFVTITESLFRTLLQLLHPCTTWPKKSAILLDKRLPVCFWDV